MPPSDAPPRLPTIRAVAQALHVDEARLVATALCTAGFPLETSALHQLLDLVEAFTAIDEPHDRQSCVAFVRARSPACRQPA